MAIFSVWIISRAGGLIYQYERNAQTIEVEKTFSYPLDFVLKEYDDKVVVAFGQRDGVKVGHVVMSINGIPVEGQSFKSDNIREDVLKYLAKEENYPLSIKFGRPKLSTNERIMLAGMFHSLFAISSQLSPVPQSSGIQLLETDTFKLHAFQTLTGIKFVIVTDIRRNNEEVLLKKLYEIYSDFALKNPFYSIDMPIRCELFDSNVLHSVDMAEKSLPF